ncbi:glucosaminidase domain-containing protein [Paenibacillus sp. GYB004]|uniref:glycoside hydrolase family 73 protein n=1 Tax=Paenibacillus sp. GYB004 TaxID=2994393 RepID=UPI002F96D969
MTNQTFIGRIAGGAVENMVTSGVLASITIAQAALETGWGASVPGNNLFGIKGSGTTQDTREYINGQWVTIRAGFRTYASWEDSIQDHSRFLHENRRYANAGFFAHSAARDYAGAARALQAAGYATDPNYASKLISIIESYGLTAYDREADQMIQAIEELNTQLAALKGELAGTKQDLADVRQQLNMPEVPDWAEAAVEAAVRAGLVDSPENGSYDFYRIITVLHRRGLI